MPIKSECTLAGALAATLRDGRNDLVARWLERIADRVSLEPNRVFPTDELLDHVPLLIDGIAGYLENPVEEISADIPVVAKAMELGELRHAQGFDAYEILKEYELLGGILFNCLESAVAKIEEPCSRSEMLVCAHRVFRAVAVIQQVTTTHFLRLADERVKEREEQLRRFNRMVTHEMKNRIGAVRGASSMLREDWVGEDPEQRDRFSAIIERNAEGMQAVLDNLMELSRADGEQSRGRNVLLADAAAEVARQLREFAEAREVEIQLASDLPRVEVPAAALELCLSNYVSNAIKYRDPGKAQRWVRVEGELADDSESGCEVVVRVRDNGLGVPEHMREKLFERFFRAHETVTAEEGTGLGLSLVRETVDSLGGRAWVEFDTADGAVFAVAFPCIALPPPTTPR